jgi:hypothetical protein
LRGRIDSVTLYCEANVFFAIAASVLLGPISIILSMFSWPKSTSCVSILLYEVSNLEKRFFVLQ